MAILFSSNFGGVSPYGFSNSATSDQGTYFTMTRFVGSGPGNRDYIRSTNLVVGDVHQFYAGWNRTVPQATSGASRFVRVRLRVGTGFNCTGNGDVWSDKWLMLGDMGGAAEGRIIAQLKPTGDNTTIALSVTKNIGATPSEGAGGVILSKGVWHSIQFEVRFGGSGYIKLWVDSDAYSSPTSQSNVLPLSTAGQTSTELGYYHNASTAAGGNVVLDYAQFQFADTFDANWHTTLGSPGADPPPPAPVPPDPDPVDPDPAQDPDPLPPSAPAQNPSPEQSVIGGAVRFSIPGVFTVDLPCFRWGYTANTVYLEREFGTTPVGTLFRAKTGPQRPGVGGDLRHQGSANQRAA
jgi:hypothetical protein